MRADRIVIAAVVFLAAGLGLLFAYCNGTTSLNVAYPFSGTNMHLEITTTGIPVLAGVPLVGAGALLLVIAFIAAIVSQFREPEPEDTADEPTKRQEPFEDFEE